MALIAAWLKVDGERLVESLQEACEKLETADGEAVLDFSSVRRIDPGAVQVMEKLAAIAEEKSLKVVLRGVSVEIYRVLKLTRMSRRFSFVT